MLTGVFKNECVRNHFQERIALLYILPATLLKFVLLDRTVRNLQEPVRFLLLLGTAKRFPANRDETVEYAMTGLNNLSGLLLPVRFLFRNISPFQLGALRLIQLVVDDFSNQIGREFLWPLLGCHGNRTQERNDSGKLQP